MWRVLRIALVALTLSALFAAPTQAADRTRSLGAQAVRPLLSDPEVPDILPFVQPGNPPRAINLRGVAGVEFRGPLTLVLPLEWTATRDYPTDSTTGHPRGLAYFSGVGPNLNRAMCQRVTLPGNQVTLAFDHRFNLQQFADFGVVELSTDEGASFTTLSDYTGTNGGWEEQELDLTEFGGRDVVICFRLLTDTDIDGEVNDGFPGWYVDNIALITTGPFTAAMTGAEEVPGPGDPDGSGTASVTLLQGLGQVCFDLSVRNIATATAAHIHRGALGVAGPVEVPLTPPAANGFSSGCVSGVSASLIGEILTNPDGFYTNVHNSAFPNGAVRGQLAPGTGEQRTVVGDGNLFPWKSESQLRPIPLTFNVSVQGLDNFGNVVVDIPIEVLPIDNGSQGGSLDRRGLGGLFDRLQNVYTAQAVVDFDLPVLQVASLRAHTAQGTWQAAADDAVEIPYDFDVLIGLTGNRRPARPSRIKLHNNFQEVGAGRPLTAVLTGPNEVPTPGDPDGRGQALITLNAPDGKVCFEISARNITFPATAAHIHRGVAGVPGPVEIPLSPPSKGYSKGCVTGVDSALIREILSQPSDFYVNVHNGPFPGGAIRGQLQR